MPLTDEQRESLTAYIDADIPKVESDDGIQGDAGDDGVSSEDETEGTGREDSGALEGSGESSSETGEGGKGTGDDGKPEGRVADPVDRILSDQEREQAEEAIYERVKARKTKPGEETNQDDILAKFPKLDPEAYEPEVIQAFEAVKETIRKQQEEIAALKEVSSGVSQTAQAAATAEVTAWFDGQIAGLGDEFQDILGKGGYSTLQPGSSPLAKRDAIAEHMAVMLAGYRELGRQAPSREKVFEIAAGNVLAKDYAKLEERRVSSVLAKRQGQHINRVDGKKQSKQKLDPFDEVAEILGQKHFGK